MATFPFNKFPETILYKSANGAFCIASGYDKEDTQNENAPKVLSIGIRWVVSRNDNQQNKTPPLGYPNRGSTPCWFIMPNDLVICLLQCIKNNPVIDTSGIDKALQVLNQQAN